MPQVSVQVQALFSGFEGLITLKQSNTLFLNAFERRYPIMQASEFFNSLDSIIEAKREYAKSNEAISRALTANAVMFGQKLGQTLAPYLAGFTIRGYRCHERAGNLPYYHAAITGPGSDTVEIAIVSGAGYELAAFYNNTRQHIPGAPVIQAGFDKPQVEAFLTKALGVFLRETSLS